MSAIDDILIEEKDVLEEFKSIYFTIKERVDNIYNDIDMSKAHIMKLNKFLDDYTRHIINISEEDLDLFFPQLFTSESTWQKIFTKLNEIRQQDSSNADRQSEINPAMLSLAEALFSPYKPNKLFSTGRLLYYLESDNPVISSNMSALIKDYSSFEILSGMPFKDFLGHFVDGDELKDIYEKYFKRSMVTTDEYVKKYNEIMEASKKEFGLEDGGEPDIFDGNIFVKRIGDHTFRFGVLYSGDSHIVGRVTRRGGSSIELNYKGIDRDISTNPLAAIKNSPIYYIEVVPLDKKIFLGMPGETVSELNSFAESYDDFFNHLTDKIKGGARAAKMIAAKNNSELSDEIRVKFGITSKSFPGITWSSGILNYKFDKDGAHYLNLTLNGILSTRLIL